MKRKNTKGNQKHNKKIKLTIAAIGVIVVVAGSVCVFLQTRANKEKEVVSKETTVALGDVVTGISESGSVTVGTISQTFDCDLSVESASTGSSSSSSSSSSSAMSGGMNAMSAMGGAQESQSASTSSSSSSSSLELEVEEVYVNVGQTIEEKAKVLKLTDASVKEAKETLQDELMMQN